MSKIAPAFIQAKKEFSPAFKTSTNPHFKSKYANLDACIEAVNEALLNNGIAMIQRTFEDEHGVTVETVFLHETGETIESGKFHVPASKQDPQGYGSALTYARRYSLMTACGIAPEDDDGNAASKPVQKPAQTKPEVKPLDAEAVCEAMHNADSVAVLDKYYESAKKRATPEQIITIGTVYEAIKGNLKEFSNA